MRAASARRRLLRTACRGGGVFGILCRDFNRTTEGQDDIRTGQDGIGEERAGTRPAVLEETLRGGAQGAPRAGRDDRLQGTGAVPGDGRRRRRARREEGQADRPEGARAEGRGAEARRRRRREGARGRARGRAARRGRAGLAPRLRRSEGRLLDRPDHGRVALLLPRAQDPRAHPPLQDADPVLRDDERRELRRHRGALRGERLLRARPGGRDLLQAGHVARHDARRQDHPRGARPHLHEPGRTRRHDRRAEGERLLQEHARTRREDALLLPGGQPARGRGRPRVHRPPHAREDTST